jgi:hypothetical protein
MTLGRNVRRALRRRERPAGFRWLGPCEVVVAIVALGVLGLRDVVRGWRG